MNPASASMPNSGTYRFAQLEETYGKHDFDFDNEDARNHELMPNDLASAADDLTRSEDRWFYPCEECYDAGTDPKHVQNSTPANDTHRKPAAHLMVDGAFNVNSVSVEAWKVMLGSLRGHAAADLKNSSGVSVRPGKPESTPVTALLAANGGKSFSTITRNFGRQFRIMGFRWLKQRKFDILPSRMPQDDIFPPFCYYFPASRATCLRFTRRQCLR